MSEYEAKLDNAIKHIQAVVELSRKQGVPSAMLSLHDVEVVLDAAWRYQDLCD